MENKLNYAEIAAKYPKAKEKFFLFMKNALETFQKSIIAEYKQEAPEANLEDTDFDLPEITEEIVAASADNTFSSGAIRSLYDFFDSTGVYTGITPTDDKKWVYLIAAPNPEEANILCEIEYENRNNAEIAAFTMAFSVLEGIL